MNFSESRRLSPRLYPYFPQMVLIHATSAFFDAAVTVTLASSALFSVQPSQARLTIFFSLIGTLAPFVLLAPSASMLVEKIRAPRIIVAICINAFRVIGLGAMALASSQSSTSRLAIFPLAFVMLTLSKCYVVAKTSALPQITTTHNFPYFSSRLSMTTGIVSVVGGSLLFAIARITSESAVLFFAMFIGACAVALSVVSFTRVRHRHLPNSADAVIPSDSSDPSDSSVISGDSSAIPSEAEGSPNVADRLEISLSRRAQSIKALFTFSSAIRFAVGVVTIAIGLRFREDEFILGLCFLSAALASFAINSIAVYLNKTKLGSSMVYLVVSGLVVVSVMLVLSSTDFSFVLMSAVLGGVGAYSRVAYESRAADIIPLDVSARLLARGEVWMQLCWVVGAACAVITFSPISVGILCCGASILSLWAYASSTRV